MKHFLDSVFRFVEEKPTVVLSVLIAVYLLDVALRAATRPLWYDELITYHLSRLSGPSELFAALRDGADGQPPLSYLVTKAVYSWAGEGELTTRLPSILAFGVMSLALFQFVARRLGSAYGFIAVLFAWNSLAYPYAYEARPYAAVLALCALSLLCWRWAARGPRRTMGLAGVTLCLAAAVSSHYYGLLIAFPLAIGEIVRSRRGQRIDIPFWGSLLLGASVVLLYMPAALAYRRTFGASFWAQVEPADLAGSIGNIVLSVKFPILIIALGFLVWRMRRAASPVEQANTESRSFPPEETAALAALALLPLLVVVTALIWTQAYTQRYVLIAVIGLSALGALAVRSLAKGGHRFAGFVLLVLLGTYLVSRPASTAVMLAGNQPQNAYQRHADLLAAASPPEDLPIAVGSALEYLEIDYYAPRELASRLLYAADPDAARSLSGSDTAELNLLRLEPWAPLRIVPYAEFLKQHDQFFILHRTDLPHDWIPRKLTQDGEQLVTIQESQNAQLLRCCQR
jgi:hypothetical protein